MCIFRGEDEGERQIDGWKWKEWNEMKERS